MIAYTQNAYPSYQFPPRIAEAALEIASTAQVSDVIAGTSCLTALSVSVSPNADWKHPLSGQTRPSVLNQAIAAISGDRKSSADELACRPIYDHDADAIIEWESLGKTYERDKALWVAFKKGLLQRLKRNASAGESTDAIETEIEKHDALEPIKPVTRRVVYQDVTRASAFAALEGNGRSIALLTDEGQTLLESTVMRHYGFLNNAWDGKQLLTYDRAKGESIIVQNPRVSISFMIQPDVLAQFFARRGKIVHSSGFCARYLFSRSPTLQGRRYPKPCAPLVSLPAFHARIRDLLSQYEKSVKSGSITRDVIEFDSEAQACWLKLTVEVEQNLGPGLFLNDISDFANKHMDMVGRIACLMHYFEADTSDLPLDQAMRAAQIGKISADTVRRANEIAVWHLYEYKQLFSIPQRQPEELDADSVYAYLYRAFYCQGKGEAPKNHVRQYCGVRDSVRLESALGILTQRQAIVMRKCGPASRKQQNLIFLNHAYFSTYPIA